MWAAGALWAGLQPSLSYTNVIRYQSRPARLSHLQADQQRHTHASHTHTSVRRGRGSAACSFAVNCRGYAMLFFCSTTLWNRWSLITVWVTGSITCRFSRSYLPLLVLSHVFSLDRCRWDPQNQSAMIKLKKRQDKRSTGVFVISFVSTLLFRCCQGWKGGCGQLLLIWAKAQVALCKQICWIWQHVQIFTF